MEKISAVYKIVNTVTGDSYIGSSNNVKRRWTEHRLPSVQERYPNNRMYQDMNTYGMDKFRFQILVPVMPEHLKQVEQELIEMLKPTYNSNNAKGCDVERQKETNRKAKRKYQQSEKGKEAVKKYQQSEKGKEAKRKYHNQLCFYNGEELTLCALKMRFQRAGIPHATQEVKKYLKKDE